MAKKKPEIQIEGLEDMDFGQKPDLKAAQSVIEKKKIPSKPKTIPQKTTIPKSKKGVFPPKTKKRATFNIDADLHKALKDYSYFEEIEMVEYVFGLVRDDLTAKGYYPPKKRRR